ncbi:hypothetical protein XENOCAPTIV_007935 [Xenoophorus captivus]|uniref:Butyrophilin subfamily 3 member A2-like Ig-C domain-containing protein n=1 Tax=Xenoophorus captivus TaxID=1517983 RepID=A0ABV0QZ58_9TELE
MKNPDFEYRTNLVMREVKNGKVSLRISSVKPLDAGTYQCLRLWKNGTREMTKVELVVVAASDPKLAVVSVDRGRVKVECEARCWLPPPLMMILDDEGNSLTNEKPEQHKTTKGCYNMKQTAILQSPISRVICRVHQQTIKQSKTAEILIPAHWMESKANSTGITVFITVVVCLFLFASCLLYRRNIVHSSSARPKKPLAKKISDQSLTSNTSESLLNQSAVSDGTEISENRINWQLKDEVKHLRSEKCQKDEIIRQQDEIIHQLDEIILQKDETIHKLQNIRSQQCPACGQHGQPTVPHSPTKSFPVLRNRSSDSNTDTTNVLRDQNPKKVASKSLETDNCKSQRPIDVPAAAHTFRREQRNQSCPTLMALVSSASKSSPSSKKKPDKNRSPFKE